MVRQLKSWKSPQTLGAPSSPTACAVPLYAPEPPSLGLPARAVLQWYGAGRPGTGDIFR